MALRNVVLDVLVPLNLPLPEIVERLNELNGVEAVEIDVKAIERKVATTSITVEGNGFDFEKVRELLENTGATVQNIDRISSGRKDIGARGVR